MWAFISPCAFSNAVLQMQAFNAWQSPNILAHKWGGGGGPPLGVFNGIGAKLLAFGLPRRSPKPPKSNLLEACVQDASQKPPKWLQRDPKKSPKVDFRRIFDRCRNLFSLFLAVPTDYLNRTSRYHMQVQQRLFTRIINLSHCVLGLERGAKGK